MAKADAYWRRTRRLTFTLLLCWFFVTFGVTWFAREINEMAFLGFPLGFYMAAQGSLVIFLLIIWWYNRQMRKIDAEFGVDED
ncbi:MAG: rane protein [Proteobacteria bacterium]|nr:rane protein [Pseudomonadota bacterium]